MNGEPEGIDDFFFSNHKLIDIRLGETNSKVKFIKPKGLSEFIYKNSVESLEPPSMGRSRNSVKALT
jgi:hypothetical protein